MATFSSAAAQPEFADRVVEFPPWIVEARADRRLAVARDDSFAATLGPTAVVSADSWTGRSLGTLAEALRRAPGVVLQESFGGFEPPRLSVRGSGLDSAPTSRGVALLVDGLPLARGDGSFHGGLFDPQLFARIEIYRGSMHAAVTPAALGGVLNAVSFPSEADAATVRAEAGGAGAARARFSAASDGRDLRHFAAGSFDRQDGWRGHSAQERAAFHTGLRRRVGDNTFAEASLYAARLHYEVPGPLTLTEAFAAPRANSAAVLRDRPERRSSVLRLAAQVKSGSAAGDAAAGLAFQRLDDRFRQLAANGETVSRSDDFNAHATLTRHLAAGPLEHRLLLRGTFSGGVNGLDRYANLAGARGPLFGRVDLRSTTAALSLEDLVWPRPDLAAGAGVTFLSARRKVADRLATPGIGRVVEAADFSPRAGLLWRFRPGLSLHAAVSRGLEPPATEELLSVAGAPPAQRLLSRELRPQRATTVELGLRGEHRTLGWNLTAYAARWSDEILRLADANGSPRGAVNAGPTRHAGLEAAFRWRLSGDGDGRLILGGTANLGRFHFAGDPVYGTNRLAGAPPLSGWFELLYEHPRGWSAALESTWTGGRTAADHGGRLTYGGHALLHLRGAWPVHDRLTVFAMVRNLLDRRHVASTAGVLDLARNPAATAVFLPGNGRTFTLGLEWTP